MCVRARHIAIKVEEKGGERTNSLSYDDGFSIKGRCRPYLRVIGGEEAVEGEHFRSGHSYTTVVGRALVILRRRQSRRRGRTQCSRYAITGLLQRQLFALLVDAEEIRSCRVASHSQHDSHLRIDK